MPKTLNLTSIDEAKIIQEAIIKGEEFEIGIISKIPFIIKLDGGRFNEYDISYINADIAKIVLSYQTNYSKLIDEIEKKFDLKLDEKDKILQFELRNGCLEIFSDLFDSEAVKTMKSRHKLYLFSVIAIIIGGSYSYSNYLEYLDSQAKNEKEIRMNTLAIEDRQDERAKYQETINQILDINKELITNKKIQNAVNLPKKETLSILKDGEKLISMDKHTLINTEASNFDYQEPNIEDIEPEPEFKEYTIKYYDFKEDGKPFKVVGIKPLVNSAMLSFNDRMKIINKAEVGKPVTLKIKFILNGLTNEVKEAYIMEQK